MRRQSEKSALRLTDQLRRNHREMYSSLILLSTLILCDSITIRYEQQDVPVAAKSKVELSPLEIYCELNDIVILSAPEVNCNEVIYNLHKPNGEITKLELTKSNHLKKSVHDKEHQFSEHNDLIIVKYINRDVKTIYPKRKFKIINANFGFNAYSSVDIVSEAERGMKVNDFMIGPLLEEDHGNWVLSVYCKDIDENWIEIFQVISIQIAVSVPMNQRSVKLYEGDTFNLSFAYPIKGLKTCELTAPRTTFDRYFDRNRIELDRCGYVITNVSRHDSGKWKVVGVGRIIYEGITNLSII